MLKTASQRHSCKLKNSIWRGVTVLSKNRIVEVMKSHKKKMSIMLWKYFEPEQNMNTT